MPARFAPLLFAAWIVLAALATLSAGRRCAAAGPEPVGEAPSALRDYVAKPDSSYRWTKRREGTLGAGSFVELILTSQTWRDVPWKHQLFIYRPSRVGPGAPALLLVGGGAWRDSLEAAPDEAGERLPSQALMLAAVAENTQTPVAVLMQVPQQPMFDGMVEDQIISYTFARFLETGDREWPLLLPMVKSAVRAMDAVQEYSRDEWKLPIEQFIVTGASKRGWTTWLAGAVDQRVSAIAPMVINMLNMGPHMELQRQSFGKYSEQIHDYTDKGLPDHLHSERGELLRSIVDPYSYRGMLPQPKLIILGTNDAYWPVDALNLYWDALEGEKHILYVPNSGHGIRDYPRVIGAVAALAGSISGGKPMPRLEWSFSDGAGEMELAVTADREPVSVTAWSATSETRDFRQSQWESTPVASRGGNGRQFLAELALPSTGFAATFAEVKFDGDPLPFFLSTGLKVMAAEQSAPEEAAAE